MPDLTDCDWIVTVDNFEIDPTHVRAAYHRFADAGQPFIEFKNADHKLVYTVASHHVVSIERVPPDASGQSLAS